MKKITILFALAALLFFSNSAIAQVSLGVKAGLNYQWMAPRPAGEESEARIGLALGGFARFKVPIAGFYVQPELMFSQKGGKTRAGSTEVVYKINNIEIPILLGKSFAGGVARFYLGPQFNFVVGAKGDVTVGSVTRTADLENYNNFYLGMQLGFGVDLTKLTIDLNFQPTLGNFAKDSGNYKPNAVQLTVGYKFM
ncbi:MAG: PorT family protein [Cytophagales bacterium]|nr:MAG: PorT family protein [Cytophagales bacterium]